MANFFIKPISGVIVRDPETMQPLPETGAEKLCSSYWLRRVNDGDVEVVVSASTVVEPNKTAKKGAK